MGITFCGTKGSAPSVVEMIPRYRAPKKRRPRSAADTVLKERQVDSQNWAANKFRAGASAGQSPAQALITQLRSQISRGQVWFASSRGAAAGVLLFTWPAKGAF